MFAAVIATETAKRVSTTISRSDSISRANAIAATPAPSLAVVDSLKELWRRFDWHRWIERFQHRTQNSGATLASGSLISTRTDGSRSKDMQQLGDMGEFLARLMSVLSSPRV